MCVNKKPVSVSLPAADETAADETAADETAANETLHDCPVGEVLTAHTPRLSSRGV